MTTLIFVQPDGAETSLDARDGDSIMETAMANGVDGIVAECGGSMMCATCHVYVEESFLDKLPAREEGEDEMLDCAASDRADNSRLSCQLIVSPRLEGARIYLPEAQ